MSRKQKCRICLKESEKYYSLFDSSQFDGKTVLINLIQEVTSVQLTMMDGYPQNLCIKCLEDLKVSCDFRYTCKLSETLLHQPLHEHQDLKQLDECLQLENMLRSVDDSRNMKYDTYMNDGDDSNSTDPLAKFRIKGTGQALLCEYCSRMFSTEPILIRHAKKCRLKKSKLYDRPDPNRKFTCNLCSKSYVKKYRLSKHYRKEHLTEEILNADTNPVQGCILDTINQKIKLEPVTATSNGYEEPCPISITFKCCVCEQKFLFYKTYKEHIASHADMDGMYGCPKCQHKNAKYQALRHHIRDVHGKREFVCTHCGFTLKTALSLRHHVRRRHTKDFKFMCGQCPRKFYFANELIKHKKMSHSTEKAISCKTCGKQFAILEQLRKHVLCHVTEGQFECDICQKVFRTTKSLEYHKGIHGPKQHFCTYCDKGFTMPKYLRLHQLTHSQEKPVQCKLCDKRFNQHSSLTRHTKRKHKTSNDAAPTSIMTLNNYDVAQKPLEHHPLSAIDSKNDFFNVN